MADICLFVRHDGTVTGDVASYTTLQERDENFYVHLYFGSGDQLTLHALTVSKLAGLAQLFTRLFKEAAAHELTAEIDRLKTDMAAACKRGANHASE